MPRGIRNRRNRMWFDALQASFPLAAILSETGVGRGGATGGVALVFPANALL